MPPWSIAFITIIFHSSGDDSEYSCSLENPLTYSSGGWDSHRQWVSDTSTSGTLSITSEDQTTQEAEEWQECALAGTEVRLLGDHWVLFTLALVPVVPRQAPQASWCCTNRTAWAGTSTGCAGWRTAPAQRQTGVWEPFAHEWGLHTCTWGTEIPWHPCAGHLLVKNVRKTCHCSAICSSS